MQLNPFIFSSVANKPFVPTHSSLGNFEIQDLMGRVDVVIVMQAMQPGWCQVTNSQGIIAVLIGLLMPAMQRVRAGDRSMIPMDLLKQGGKFGVLPSTSFTYQKIESVYQKIGSVYQKIEWIP